MYNTPLLSALMDETASQTLIDHELLTAPHKDGGLRRVAAFGWYAGAVGAGEALCLTGLALLKRGIASPLLVSAPPRTESERNLTDCSASRSTIYIHIVGRVQGWTTESGRYHTFEPVKGNWWAHCCGCDRVGRVVLTLKVSLH